MSSIESDVRRSNTAATVAQWRETGEVLEQMRRDNLRRLTDAEALETIERLLDLLPLPPPRDNTSGLVQQQRLFAPLRE